MRDKKLTNLTQNENPAKEQERTKRKKKEFLKNYEKFMGIIKYSCSATRISKQTYYNWIAEDVEFKSRLEDMEQRFFDEIEGKLLKKIQEDDMKAIQFYLSRKHPDFKNQRVIGGEITTNVNNYQNLNAEQLDELIEELERMEKVESNTRQDKKRVGG